MWRTHLLAPGERHWLLPSCQDQGQGCRLQSGGGWDWLCGLVCDLPQLSPLVRGRTGVRFRDTNPTRQALPYGNDSFLLAHLWMAAVTALLCGLVNSS